VIPVTAAIGPIFAGRFGKTLGAQTVDAASHFKHAGLLGPHPERASGVAHRYFRDV
jgi:hypothetical protein